METASSLSRLESFEPHGQCFLWNPDLVLLHTISDSITALAYYSIPIALLYFVRKRQDLPYKWIFVLFSAFFVACGATHLMAIWTIWKPVYWLQGAIKGVNAAVSIVAAGLLWPTIPRLLRLPSPAQLEAANQELQKEVAVRKLAEAELSAAGQDLERQVRERTAELVQANAALRADITERTRTENDLLETAQALQSLIHASPVSIVVLDYQGAVKLWNPAAERTFGWCEEEVRGGPLPTVPPDKQEEYRAFRERVLSGNALTGIELRRQKKDGTPIDISLSAAPLRDAAGRIVGILGLMDDITERKRMEDELRSAALYARSLIEASLDPLATISQDGKIADVNTATEAVTGLPRERLIGSDFSEYFTKPESAKEGYHQVLAQGAVRDYPLTVRHASGRLTEVLYNAAIYCNREGIVQGVLATAHDITARKRMQEQASRVERLAALGQLLGGIAHEIKNPLFVVTGRIQLLKEMLANGEYDAAVRDLLIVEEAGRRMTEITQRFLGLARPVKPQWQKCWVHDVLAHTLDFLANELMKNRIAVVRSFAPDIPKTWSEPRQLYDVFLNVMLNAMQAMTVARGRGTLTITTGRENDSIVIRIQDDGPGISPRHHARLFEPFFSTKPPDQGTGLGLWTVKSTLAELNGTVECESVEGRGATFIVRIPIVSHPPKE